VRRHKACGYANERHEACKYANEKAMKLLGRPVSRTTQNRVATDSDEDILIFSADIQ
jgi:hypothetical protein